jgi:hypothetical protein
LDVVNQGSEVEALTEEHMNILLLLWILTGGGISTAVMMHYWRPDPPPNFSRFIKILVAGALGGLASGYLVHHSLASAEPMPGIVAAAFGGLILSGFVVAGSARK